jgi:hypothetical protein
MIKLPPPLPLFPIESTKKIAVTQTEYKNIIQIKHLNDIDLVLFTKEFFKKMQISSVDIQIKYDYYKSNKNITLKGDDTLQTDARSITDDSSIPFIKKRSNLIEYIWEKINSLYNFSENEKEINDNEPIKSKGIVLSDKMNKHPNPDYKYNIIVSYDKLPDESITTLYYYLNEARNNTIDTEHFLPSKLTYYEIGKIIYDIHQQLLFLKSMSIFIVEIALEDVYIIQDKFIIINTQRMISLDAKPEEKNLLSNSKKYANVMLNFIKKIISKDIDEFMKEIEFSYLYKYITRLLNDEFQI